MMRRQAIILMLFSLGLSMSSVSQADTVSDLLTAYSQQGAGPFSSDAGRTLLLRKGVTENGNARSCTSCHGEQLKLEGRHTVTGKTILPMAPSINPERATDQKKIEKWFKRNCKWTFGRECTPQEKGDFLSFLKTQ